MARCPICRKPSVAAHRPFCSKRCATLDLSRWLNGAYVVASEPEDGEAFD
ncbi:MAG: DNA gyrase inhibitor YacG [Pseudomonadota bacterium]